MSSFICEHCGKEIIDTSNGYITGCKHYPLEEANLRELTLIDAICELLEKSDNGADTETETVGKGDGK